jgi:hypothetical protein
MPTPHFTSQEGPALQAEGARVLGEQLARFATLEQRMQNGATRVMPGSESYYDDLAAEYDPPSMQAEGLIAVAVDHLVTVRVLVSGSEENPGMLPAMAGYTLMRSVVEASAIGLWLRMGGTRNKRVLASLRHSAKNRRDAEPAAKSLGVQNPAGMKRMTQRLEEIRDRRPQIRGRDLDTFPTISDTLRTIERLVPKGQFTPLGGWQAMSGLAHANRTAMLMLLEREQITAGDDVGKGVRMTSSLWVFAHLVKLGLDCLETLVDLVTRQATTIDPKWRGESTRTAA